MATRSLGLFFDRFKSSLKTHICVVCNKVDLHDPVALVCPVCEKRLQMKSPFPTARVDEVPVYAACGMPFALKRLIYDLKFARKHQHGPLLAEILAHYWQGIPASRMFSGGIIIPVPPHEVTESAHVPLFARPLASHLGVRFVEDALVWSRVVRDQHNVLSRVERKDNVHGALRVNPKYLDLLNKGTPVMVVDDILTTGATMGEAVSALTRVQPQLSITGLTIAHVPMSTVKQSS